MRVTGTWTHSRTRGGCPPAEPAAGYLLYTGGLLTAAAAPCVYRAPLCRGGS